MNVQIITIPYKNQEIVVQFYLNKHNLTVCLWSCTNTLDWTSTLPCLHGSH